MEKRIFDENTKRKLSGLLPFAPDSFVVWNPEEYFEFPKEAQPVFHVKPFDESTCRYIRSAATSGVFDIEHARKAIQSAFPFWKNLIRLPDLEDVPYTPEAFAQLPEALVWIMYLKAKELTYGMSQEEKEGLGSQRGAGSAPLNKAAENADSTPA